MKAKAIDGAEDLLEPTPRKHGLASGKLSGGRRRARIDDLFYPTSTTYWAAELFRLLGRQATAEELVVAEHLITCVVVSARYGEASGAYQRPWDVLARIDQIRADAADLQRRARRLPRLGNSKP